MLFNSIDFAVFLPIVFLLYWLVFSNNVKQQNLLLLIVSYVFYGWWDYRFLFLIFFSTVSDFLIGLLLKKENREKYRKHYLKISILINLTCLGFFKYFNFFVDTFVNTFHFFGTEIKPTSLNIILPVGISFYTFQTLSYTIDVYKGKINPSTNFISFAAFVSFFPQLVAGPIEKAKDLLPQLHKKRVFNLEKVVEGLKQILWGLFKKIVIADSCAKFANLIFDNYSEYSGLSLLMGTFFFAFQIYGDFSGYSDIAIGTSKLFSIKLSKNFSTPYFSKSIPEFWKRWHISLNTWFKDYLYIPLGGNRVKTSKKVRNIFLIFIVSGFWHGANWTFIFWGAINALFFLPTLFLKKKSFYFKTIIKSNFFYIVLQNFSILTTFLLICFTWVFFRSKTLNDSFSYIYRMFFGFFKLTGVYEVKLLLYKFGLLLSIVFLFFILVEWCGRKNNFAIEKISKNQFLRWIFYSLLIFLIGMFSRGSEIDFIYFQF